MIARHPFLMMAAIGLTTGFLSGRSIFVSNTAFAWMPGLIYGVPVTFFLSAGMTHRVMRSIGGGMVGTAAYYIAVLISLYRAAEPSHVILGFCLAGFVGSLLAGAGILAVLDRSKSIGVFFRFVMTGTVAGLVFGIVVVVLSNNNFYWPIKFTAGYMIWQSSTAASLGGLRLQRKAVRGDSD